MEHQPQAPIAARHRGISPRGLALLVLVLLADTFFDGHRIGLSLALFAALTGIALRLLTGRSDTAGAALLTLAILPVVEDVNALSVIILTLGLIILALRAQAGSAIGWAQMPLSILAFIAAAPLRAAMDAPAALRHLRLYLPVRPTRTLQDWCMPLGLGACFSLLLVLSNPVLLAQAGRLLAIDLAPGSIAQQVGFWLAMAAAIWPLLAIPRRNPAGLPVRITPAQLGINATSVSHALILFNALFAVQTALDLTYLWAGTTLPDGMTPATYAHRGAYPLLATALLAGVFTLISRPFAHGRLRVLLIIWIAQNILLVISALYRLDLYVQTFGLTYLRLAAGIWMALVAAGLALTAWQILRRHSNAWLLVRCTLLGIGTLYTCAFINFAHLIASVNLQRPTFDRHYICNLGPNAAAAIRAYALQNPQICWTPPHMVQGWRDWGFRTARVQRYLAANPIAGPRS